MLHQSEFGSKYALTDVELSMLMAVGFVDNSDGNDAAPSFLFRSPYLNWEATVFADAANPSDREAPESPRCLVTWRYLNCPDSTLYRGDSLSLAIMSVIEAHARAEVAYSDRNIARAKDAIRSA